MFSSTMIELSAGMLVDNSIIVLENITRHLREASTKAGTKLVEGSTEAKRLVAWAAEHGGRQMSRPVLAGTLTTVCVYFPVVYVPGIAGAFFRDQALTVTFSLMISILAALLLQPVLAARILKVRPGEPHGLFKLLEKGFTAFHDRYHVALEWALQHRRIMFVGLAMYLGLGAWYATTLDRSFMPERSSGDLRLDLELPAGTPLEQTVATVAALAETIEEDEAVRSVFTQVGQTERTLAAMQDYTAPHTARLRIILKAQRGAFEAGRRLQRQLTERLEKTPGMMFAFREEGIGLGEIFSITEAPFTLGVMAEEAQTAVAAAEQLMEELANISGLTDLQVDRVLGTPNLVVHLDRDRILRNGLDPDVVATELRHRIAGVEATTFNEVEQRIDIAVRFEEHQRRDLASALSAPVSVPGGRTVPMQSFLELREERPVRELVRRNQRRMVTISGNIDGRPQEEVWRDVHAAARRLDLPGDVTFDSGGERSEMQRSFRDLGWAFVLAVVLVYMILAAQFESFLDPLLIAAVIPLGLCGSALAIGVSGNSINVLSLIGILALLGVDVNDAIVKIDTIRELRASGMAPHQAVMQASTLRLRPIVMVTCSTVLAMLPMAIGLGSGEQLQRPLAITIIGGLTLSSTLTLLYTPLFYETAHRIRGGRA
jgi:HAE1 family hydrophobic/amphiphilic exporter-1